MPKGKGYAGMGYGAKHDAPKHNYTSYKDSPAKTPAVGRPVNRHGFGMNPKANHEFRRGDKSPFPDNPGQGVKGNAGLSGSSKSPKGY